MYYDVYLGGVTTPKWREDFKSHLSNDISIFDPYVNKFDTFTKEDKAEQIARELYFIEQCDIIIFYLSSAESSKSARLQIGDAVGHDKQVIVCLDEGVEGASYIEHYCEYRGVILVNTIEELVTTVEEYAAEVELCNFEEE